MMIHENDDATEASAETSCLGEDENFDRQLEGLLSQCSGSIELVFESPAESHAFQTILRSLSNLCMFYVAAACTLSVWYLVTDSNTDSTKLAIDCVVVFMEQVLHDSGSACIFLLGYILAYVMENSDFSVMYFNFALWVYVDIYLGCLLCLVVGSILQLSIVPQAWTYEKIWASLSELFIIHIQVNDTLSTLNVPSWLILGVLQSVFWAPYVCKGVVWMTGPYPHMSITAYLLLVSSWVFGLLIFFAQLTWHKSSFMFLATSPFVNMYILSGGIICFYTQPIWRLFARDYENVCHNLVLCVMWVSFLTVLGQPFVLDSDKCARIAARSPCLPDLTIALPRGVMISVAVLVTVNSRLPVISDDEAREARFELSNCAVNLYSMNAMCSALALAWPVCQCIMLLCCIFVPIKMIQTNSLLVAWFVVPCVLMVILRVWQQQKPWIVSQHVRLYCVCRQRLHCTWLSSSRVKFDHSGSAPVCQG